MKFSSRVECNGFTCQDDQSPCKENEVYASSRHDGGDGHIYTESLWLPAMTRPSAN